MKGRSDICRLYCDFQVIWHSKEDPQGFQRHSGILRTIKKAGVMPLFKNSKGRSGLHYLAEVAFYLVGPDFTR